MSRAGRVLAGYLPPLVVAFALAPWIIAGGRPWPWDPAMVDLDVYREAGRTLLSGGDIYTMKAGGLYFIYPPFAALLAVPLALVPAMVADLAWLVLGVSAQQTVLSRCGVPAGWRLGLVGAGVIVAVEPIRTTLGYGQVNTLLMALVVLALLPDPGLRPTRWRGAGIGLAAAIKLTPALFGVFALVAHRARVAWTSAAAFVLVTAISAVLLPGESVRFWTGDIPAGTSGPQYVGNASLTGLTTRWFGTGTEPRVAGLVLGVSVCLLALVIARHWWLGGHPVFAVALVGLATNLASPLAWTHHFVWVLPLLVAVLTDTGLPRWARGLGLAWAVWIAVQLPLTVLPYAFGAAAHYTWWQDLIGNVTPLVGLAIYLGLGIDLLIRRRLSAGRAPEPAVTAMSGR